MSKSLLNVKILFGVSFMVATMSLFEIDEVFIQVYCAIHIATKLVQSGRRIGIPVDIHMCT